MKESIDESDLGSRRQVPACISGPTWRTNVPVKAVSKDGIARPLPNLTLTRGDRLVFLQMDDALIVLKGNVSQKEFYRVDLNTGHERQLTKLGRELAIRAFDVAPDGREIIFNRMKEESEIVLFNLTNR